MKLLLLAMVLGFFSGTAISKSTETETIETPDGPVTITQKTVVNTPQKITAATQKEIVAINSHASKAKEFVAAYVPDVRNPALKDFDEAFHRWQNEKHRQFTEQQVVEILGSYLGNKLINDFQMEWVIVTDQYGTDYAVRSKIAEVMSFPFSSVSKRIENNQHEFMVSVYEAVRHTVASGNYKTR